MYDDDDDDDDDDEDVKCYLEKKIDTGDGVTAPRPPLLGGKRNTHMCRNISSASDDVTDFLVNVYSERNMAAKTMLEINVIKLLKKCEEMGKENSKNPNWKLEKYVEAARNMLSELQKKNNKPDPDTMNEYMRRTDFLQKLVESQKIENPVERILAIQMMSHGVSTPDGVVMRELHQKTASECNADVRKELFNSDNGDRLRLRVTDKSSGEDYDSLIKYHNTMREKIAEDMLIMTRNLKEQTQLAGNIIKSDINIVQKSSGIADKNLSKLKIESARLEEHNRRAWKCWMWVLIVIVMVIFINMILFMKIMKKKVS